MTELCMSFLTFRRRMQNGDYYGGHSPRLDQNAMII